MCNDDDDDIKQAVYVSLDNLLRDSWLDNYCENEYSVMSDISRSGISVN